MLQYEGAYTGTILIRGARQLLTLRGPKGPRRGDELNQLGLIADGAVLVRDGVVQEVGPTRRVENLAQARGAVEINAAGRVVMPGFVDSHTHMVFPPPGAPNPGESLRAVHAGTGQRIERKLRAHLEALARHGTTTLEAKTGCGPDEHAEGKLLRALATFRKEPVEVVPTFQFRLQGGAESDAAGLDAQEALYADLLAKVRKRRLARFADVAWDQAPDRQPYYRRFVESARMLGLACKIHAAAPEPTAAVQLALACSAASVDHLESCSAEDASLLTGASAVATVLPISVLRGGPGSSARGLIDAGAAVALASDFYPYATPALNMQTVVALACLSMRFTPAEAISAATINGAHALGIAARAGSLELNKSADLLLLNISDYREMANHVGINLVHMTMKRGEFIYQEAEVAPQPAEDLRLAW